MIEIKNLDFSYGKHKVFSSLDISFKEGSVYGLLGKNGVGKTTLMKLVCGLLKDDGGRLDVDGYVPFERKPSFLERVFYMPETFQAPACTVMEYALKYGRFYPHFDKELFMDCLSALDVDPQATFSKQSFGQQKKAFIAYAVSLNTELLLMDEPGNGLDIPSRVQFKRLVSKVSGPGKSIVISTHQVKDIENVADHIIILDKGRVAVDVPLETVTKRLLFIESAQELSHALVSVPAANGFVNICLRDRGCEAEGKADLEALFGAVLENGAGICEILKKEADYEK